MESKRKSRRDANKLVRSVGLPVKGTRVDAEHANREIWGTKLMDLHYVDTITAARIIRARHYVDAVIDHLQVACLGLYSGFNDGRAKAHAALCAELGVDEHTSRSVTDHLDRLGLPLDPGHAATLDDAQRETIARHLLRALCCISNAESAKAKSGATE